MKLELKDAGFAIDVTNGVVTGPLEDSLPACNNEDRDILFSSVE